MDNLNRLIEKISLENQIGLEDIPSIDLYMDQVIQLFENKFAGSKRNENEKVLTKTMINNYAKGKLFIPIKNKKYSKQHLILISLIYQLKGGLSINDIKATLDGINEKIIDGDIDLERFYNSYLSLSRRNIESFKEDLKHRASETMEEVAKLEDKQPAQLEKILLVASLVNISQLYRRAAEKLVDEIIAERES
ncbi:hypothetical protein CVD25_19750 [Bacillus canaveralius]|uniref:DUF1836 domain-containing protein n=1 Tax=Bacillus canaveralius TaxID=1403243 RepID=A0A2N5GIZ2_9BACI|nr:MULTISPECIES: DUF1836 domain-containing protein [Bacillus]PLR80933.1 hypothetical protein CU635_16865 [Bacillus canaveralius]PLR81695.1 hypothetical protein CVD23_18125 [Bacillus sp. V33-4]PLR91221.1 hypothetical protein CVD25_19750 [Bacillus canaveralius]